MKNIWIKNSLLFVFVTSMFLSLGAGGYAFAEDEEEEAEPELSEYQQIQIKLIESKLDELLQTDDQNTWYYCIMDLDHNGQMEFFAADQHPVDRSTNLKVWEVNSDTTDMTECVVEIQPDESFPDIISNSADTFYDYNKERWSYLFYDNVVLSPVEVDLKGKTLLLVKPPVGVDTRTAYSRVVPAPATVNLAQVVALPVTAWDGLLVNDFEPSVFAALPQLWLIKAQLMDAGAQYAAMSGSGSTVFGIFNSDKLAETAADTFADCATFVLTL